MIDDKNYIDLQYSLTYLNKKCIYKEYSLTYVNKKCNYKDNSFDNFFFTPPWHTIHFQLPTGAFLNFAQRKFDDKNYINLQYSLTYLNKKCNYKEYSLHT